MNDVNQQIEQMVNDALARTLRSKDEPQGDPLFESIEAYTKATGKRFRMTKDQIDRGISREEAFKEFTGNHGK